jgi:hypothetical protein
MRPFALLAALALAGCAAATPQPQPQPQVEPGRWADSATLALGSSARLGPLTVRALRLEEDSRCPESVQCVHAGTVRLRVAIGGREAVLRLHEAHDLASGRWIELVAACPEPRVPGPIPPAAYRFRLLAANGPVAPPSPGPCPPAP